MWAGRELELSDAHAAAQRRLAGVYERGRAVLGEFGIGKSVLVNRIAGEFAADGHWVAEPVRVPKDADPVPLLAEVVRDLAARRDLDQAIGKRAGGLLARIGQITLPVVGGGVTVRARADDDLVHREVLRLVDHVARLAAEERRLVVLRVDEVQNASLRGLSRLLTLLGDALEAWIPDRDPTGAPRERLLPLVVYLSGLPDFRDRVADAGGTFARRFRTFELEPLGQPELREALLPFLTDGWPVLTDEGHAVVHMEGAAADHLVEACLGDPFLFQLAGEAAWNSGDGNVITAVEARRGWQLIRREVVRYVEGRLSGLGDVQLAFLRAAAPLPDADRSVAAVASAMGRQGSESVASTAQALDRTHRLIRREAGKVRFRSPAVQAFLAGDWP